MITVTIITKNEEKNLRILLSSIQKVRHKFSGLISEVLVLDSGSQDQTVLVCEEFGVRFESQSFLGYGPQKRMASLLAKNNWILNLDADEFPDFTFWKSLAEFMAVSVPLGIACASLERDLYMFGKKLRFGGASEQRRTRLFDRSFYDWNAQSVHEDVVWIQIAKPTLAQLQVFRLQGKVHHHSWKSVSHWLDATNRRSDVQATERLAKANGSGFMFWIFVRFFLEFVRSYFLRFGFLDGVRGFVFCFLMAFSHEIKIIKMYEKMVRKNSE